MHISYYVVGECVLNLVRDSIHAQFHVVEVVYKNDDGGTIAYTVAQQRHHV